MKASFVKKSANAFFQDKKALVLCDLENIGGETIRKGSHVVITGKNARNKQELNVKIGDVVINGINPEHLQLLHEDQYSWPIERDTLDLREHEFNFNNE